jgi:hypothetical protein
VCIGRTPLYVPFKGYEHRDRQAIVNLPALNQLAGKIVESFAEKISSM